MKTFSAMAVGEKRTRSVGFVNQLLSTDVISSFSVTPSIYVTSASNPDPTPILVGSPALNVIPVTIQGILNPAGTALLQEIAPNVTGAVYALRFALNLSDGRVYYEDVIQPVTAYVPPQ